MKLWMKIALVILVFLAVSSGFTKILLMPQDLDFFGQYGFTDTLLILYGSVQLIAGILLILPKTRVIAAVIVAITFLISMIVLMLSGNIGMALFTLVFVVLLAFVAKGALKELAK